MSAGDVAAAVILAAAILGVWASDCAAHAAEAQGQAFATVVEPIEIKSGPDGGGGPSAPGQVQLLEGGVHVVE